MLVRPLPCRPQGIEGKGGPILRKRMDWIILFLLAVALLVAAKQIPYFPGDIPLARWIQRANPAGTEWGKWVTPTAIFPSSYVFLWGK